MGSGLVHMPTGSGKTGVIAVLARCIPEKGCVLFLTPRVALRQQLVRGIRARFFERLETAPEVSQIPNGVAEVIGSFSNLEYEDINQTVSVATIQKLQSMARRAGEQLEEAANAASDEAAAANQQSDDYILNAVILASILFLGGIVSRFDWPPVRIGIIVVALALLAYGLYNLAIYPVA
jgi:type I site-specific restriction endonuclease